MNERLFFLREYEDLTQTQIAEKIGVSQQNYSLWENGTKTIPLKHLNNLCNYYGVTMDYVVKLSNKKYDSRIKKINNLDKHKIGKRIVSIRKSNKLTLRELADVLNTSSSTLSVYETGKVLILMEFAYQICKKYNLSLDWLCGRIN